jgi:hypothetical protein
MGRYIVATRLIRIVKGFTFERIATKVKIKEQPLCEADVKNDAMTAS